MFVGLESGVKLRKGEERWDKEGSRHQCEHRGL